MCCIGEVIKFQNNTTMQLNWFYSLSITRQAIYVECNTEAHLCNQCCSGKAINVTYSESVFVILFMQCEMHMRHFIVCGFSGSKVFFPHYLINGTIFEKNVTKHKMCVLVFCTTSF